MRVPASRRLRCARARRHASRGAGHARVAVLDDVAPLRTPPAAPAAPPSAHRPHATLGDSFSAHSARAVPMDLSLPHACRYDPGLPPMHRAHAVLVDQPLAHAARAGQAGPPLAHTALATTAELPHVRPAPLGARVFLTGLPGRKCGAAGLFGRLAAMVIERVHHGLCHRLSKAALCTQGALLTQRHADCRILLAGAVAVPVLALTHACSHTPGS